jgi:hypothetical protein
MTYGKLHLREICAFSALAGLLWIGAPAMAQSNSQSAPVQDPVRDNDTTRAELARFDQFLDGHPEIAEQLRKNPSLVNSGDFVKNHPALQTYLRDHQQVREELRENPNAFMREENRFDRREDARGNDTTRAELASFDRFLDGHREIAEQVRKNPSLVNNQAFIENHPALLDYLHDHPAVREEIRENPNAFMRQEDRFDRREDARDRDNDAARAEKDRFNQFLDGHREIAEQVRKNPSLVNDDGFVRNHPELQAYLQEHPEIRQQARQNPDTFIAQGERFDDRAARPDDRYDRRDDSGNRDASRDRSANFREFLGSHTDIAHELSRDPSLANNREYVENHPEFRDYLKSHPDVNQELMKNPQTFVKSSQPFNNNEPGAKPGMPAPKASY